MIAALALAGLAFYVVAIRSRTGAERVKHMVDWDETCRTVELKRSRAYVPDYARLWKGVEEHARIFCTDLGGGLFYARFATPDAGQRAVVSSPPLYRSCESNTPYPRGSAIGDERVGRGAAFRRRCPHGQLLGEDTERYCLAADEVVVDGYFDGHEFDDFCDELGGTVARAPRSVLGR